MLTPIRIDNRINGFLGHPGGADKRPAVIHLHERYGIVQHTMDLAHKLVDAGYVTVVPDLFWRFTGDRQALARGDSRVELCDEEVLQDVDAIVTYLCKSPFHLPMVLVYSWCFSQMIPRLKGPTIC